jgi:hypothetical protein
MADLRRAIIETPGATTPSQRQAAAAGESTGTSADAYLAKVRGESYRIADSDVADLMRTQLTEDAVFELTLAAAFGEAHRRFDRAMTAMRTPPGEGG